MRELFPKDLRRKIGQKFLAADARVDSTLYTLWAWSREQFERYSAFMDRFHIGGWKRLPVELLSEGATLGTGGLVLLLALATSAFHETSDPDWLKKSDLAVTFLDRYGNVIGSRGIKHNDSIPLSEFPDTLIKAAISTEDRRFYDHFGIDVPGTLRALVTNARAGGVRQGGSSITQQLAKNLFLSNERTIERKINEAFLAMWLESRLTKNQILKLYLDRAYMGGGAFGVDAAAHFYFNKSVRDINLAESAMLAGLFKAPTKFAPHVNLPAARARANQVLDNLVEAGFMTEGQVFGARRHPASVVDRRDESSPDYYLDYAFEEVKKIVDTLPKSLVERAFIVRTAIDTGLQKTADEAVENNLRQFGHEYHVKQAAMVVAGLDGGIRAMVGGRDYGASQFNRATDAMRQPGSSFKPYVYTTALLNGFKPSSVVVDGPICIGNWCPSNYGHSFAGPVTLTQAITRSINIIPVKLSVMLGKGSPRAGRAKIIETARKFGITTPLPDTPSLPIGADAVNLLEHTVAIATLPNEGKRVAPHAVLEIRTAGGELVWRFDRDGPKPKQVIPPKVADDMNMMMSKVVEQGTARRAILDGIKAGGKTGTTNAYRDAWFVGFTGNFIAGVWFGNDDFTPTNKLTGGALPAQTWHTVMEYAHQGIELKPLPGVPGTDLKRNLNAMADDDNPGKGHPIVLSKKGADVLTQIEHVLDDATRHLTPDSVSSTAPENDTVASRASTESGVRGN